MKTSYYRKKEFSRIYPYTYTVTRISDGKQYHGVRYGNLRTKTSPDQDIGTLYFTSGIFKKEFKSNPKNFLVKLRWTFPSIEMAINWESKINKKLMKKIGWANAAIGKGCADIEKLKERRKAAFIKKYGVDHNFKIKNVVEKRNKTIKKLYGVENPGASPIIRKKVFETCMKKYGCGYSFQSEDVKNKIKNSLLEKYGVDNPLKSSTLREKLKKNNVKNFGCEYTFQRKDVIKKINEKRTEMYVKLATMTDDEFEYYLKNISQNVCVQRQKITQRKKGIEILKEGALNGVNID